MSVVNRRTAKSWDVYVGRPSKWGNPYVLGRDGTREEVIEKYRLRLLEMVKDKEVVRELAELDGKVLACWCSPLPCHADVLERAAKWATTQL